MMGDGEYHRYKQTSSLAWFTIENVGKWVGLASFLFFFFGNSAGFSDFIQRFLMFGVFIIPEGKGGGSCFLFRIEIGGNWGTE